ncbi:MAG: hypothetical protein N2314_07500 [Brevinematales bacterium]|nr:hypothetical protein [Brevinematales bacterium]
MKPYVLLAGLFCLILSCGKATKAETITELSPSPETHKEASEKQNEVFEVKLRDTTVGEVEKAYLQFRLFLNHRISNLTLHPTLVQAFSNEFVSSLEDTSAYRSAYLSYLALTNVFTNTSEERAFLLGRAGIAAFKGKQYSLAIQILRQAFEIQVTDETLYYYGLWYWYIQKDKTKAKEILSRLRPERLGIDKHQWKAFLLDSVPPAENALSLLQSSNPSDQVKGFFLWLEEYKKTGEPFWSYETALPPYLPPSSSVGYYLSAMGSQFPRMTRDWPMPFSIRPGKPGQNRYALMSEDPLEEERFLFLYAQPIDFPWKSGYQGLTPVFSRPAYTNAFFVYASPQRETNNKITNLILQTVSIPVRYFLSSAKLYRQGTWHYVIVGFQNPDILEVVVFDPLSQRFSRLEVSLRKIQHLYYLRHPLSGEWCWLGVGKTLVLLEEKPISR